MDKIKQKLKDLLKFNETHSWCIILEKIQRMLGADFLFNRITLACDANQLRDYLTEAIFAFVFDYLKFNVQFAEQGPDLIICRDDHKIKVEVTRFRKMYPGPPELGPTYDFLPEYGNPPRDIKKAIEKICQKFPQIKNGESIIAIWNDDEDMEDGEVKTAVNEIKDRAKNGLSVPEGLLFVLYASIGEKIKQSYCFQQLYCFPFQFLDQWHQNLVKELESIRIKF